MLGVPGNPLSLARSGLISWRGKARAALEPLLPRSSTDHDNIGRYVRARFGDEVHERLVDALVGSIYAADTDDFSLAEIPQLAALTGDRSLLLAARRVARRSRRHRVGRCRADLRRASRRDAPAGRSDGRRPSSSSAATLRLGREVTVEPVGVGLAGRRRRVRCGRLRRARRSSGSRCVDGFPPSAHEADRADVVMVTLHVSDDEFPERLRGRSGYLVPKPVQRDVTAVSFGSQKWAHWAPPAGGEILRVSLGRDGAPVLHLDDDEIVTRTLDDLRRHLGVTFSPIEVRLTRWPGAFAQYRPHHRRWVDTVRAGLAPGIFVAGSSYDGIGIPACVRSGRTIAEHAVTATSDLAS